MKNAMKSVRKNASFRAALVVPSLITLLFSFFNLTAPPDSARLAMTLHVGLVNQDAGTLFPPINVGKKLAQGFATQFPFPLDSFKDEEQARAALEKEQIAAIIILPKTFTKDAFGNDPVRFTVVNAGNLTMAASQIAAQLPVMLKAGVGAAISSLRLAIAKGQLPTGALPVDLSVETIHKPANAAASMAPFAASYTIWLSAMVGAIMLFNGTGAVSRAGPRARLIAGAALLSSGLSSLTLAAILSVTAGLVAGFLAFWATAWAISLALAWLINGLFSVFRWPALLVVVPVVFYQVSLGGTQVPLAAAPDWLQAVGAIVPFEQVGGILRTKIIGGQNILPAGLALWTAGVGLVAIWVGALIWRKKGAVS
jgi:uncharacterized phage infection (PIP) family protein YhgE